MFLAILAFALVFMLCVAHLITGRRSRVMRGLLRAVAWMLDPKDITPTRRRQFVRR